MSGILFIDAEQPFSDQTASALRSRGFDVKQFDDGNDGLNYATKSRPDLIVLCVELPTTSGYSICNKFKKHVDLKGIPLIITSKESTPETFAQHKKLKTRAEDYLIKPFSDTELVHKITAMIPAPDGGAEASASGAVHSDPDQVTVDVPTPSAADESLPDLNLGDEPLLPLDPGQGQPQDGDLMGLDGLDPQPAGGGSAAEFDGDLPPALDDYGLAALEGLDGLTGQSEALDELDLDAKLQETDLAAGLASLADTDLPPILRPVSVVAPAALVTRIAVSLPPLAATSSHADLQALHLARHENGELKSKVVELGARLKQAEEQAKQAASVSLPPSASSAREVLTLKQQLRAKDDEILEKEQAIVEVQEQFELYQQDTAQKLGDSANKDIELATLRARVSSLSEERDEVETQMQVRLGEAETAATELRAAFELTQQQGQADVDAANARGDEVIVQLEEVRSELDSVKSAMEASTQRLEAELKEKEQDLINAYERMKSEEALRLKAYEAAELIVSMLRADSGGTDAASELEL